MNIKKSIITSTSSILSVVSYKNLCRFMYFLAYKRLPNLKKPKLMSEKIMWSAINQYKCDPLVAKCADKVSVRDYIEEKGYAFILNTIYGVWDNANRIDWDHLPSKFVLKCNHASGFNIICTDKSKLNIQETEKKLNKWLATDYWKQSGEIFYKNIPKRIICEKFIETSDGKPPKDYKFFCSHGKVKFLFVAMDRVNNETKFNFFTPEWVPIPVTDIAHPPYKGDIPKPKELEEMIRIAEDLSKPWGQVRVDFYCESDQIVFGELTFMHHGGKPQFSPQKYDKIFGDLFDVQ
ncbi:ATP-grasp fold amidoligase family protein [uncultured Ruminococcus sp.]|uniref:ATP-grasp fold amidoligase family protein n=1 Tax=uncultured Ruminococcus sp. TaxID=165186 RepID=UPI0026601792|nr:ATP-grasp fold amidoligase family protein [uncultured Ruminococcus sp.]